MSMACHLCGDVIYEGAPDGEDLYAYDQHMLAHQGR